MYREKPWTLCQKKKSNKCTRKSASSQKTQNKPNKVEKGSIEKQIICLFRNPKTALCTKEIANHLNLYPEKIHLTLRHLVNENKLKIVDFTIRSNRLSPIYQSIKGPNLSVPIIIENSKEFKKLKLISLRKFCENDYRFYCTMLSHLEKVNISSFIVRTSNGFFEMYKKEDLQQMKLRTNSPVPLSEPNGKINKDRTKIKLKIFGWEIAVKKSS